MGRPPKEDRDALLRERVTFLTDIEMRDWIAAQDGGAGAYLRRLVEEDRKRRGE